MRAMMSAICSSVTCVAVLTRALFTSRVNGSASSDIIANLRDHARLIASEVSRVLEDEHMSLAAI